MMDTKKIRAAFEREFRGMSFEEGVERLETLIGRFLRMGYFGDGGIVLARNVDYGGGRTTIDDRDFALVAFFAGAGRLALTEDMGPASVVDAVRSLTERAPRDEIALTAESDEASFPISGRTVGTLEEESARENPVGLAAKIGVTIDLDGDDITGEVTLGALKAIVDVVKSYRYRPLNDAAFNMPNDLAASVSRLFENAGTTLRIDATDFNVTIKLAGGVRVKVSPAAAYGITLGSRGAAA